MSDGSGCVTCSGTTECPCLLGDAGPCHSMDNCLNYGGGSHGCDPCPEGFEGDGVTCTDIDEVIALVFPHYCSLIKVSSLQYL